MTARVFEASGPLPTTGTTVLEASAGTGKTTTIAALATRYVAEGVTTLERLLLVTFGRAATSELRERVRDRLVRAEERLHDPGAHPADDLVQHLAAVPPEELRRRQERLVRALADFDAATIATTHGFCQQVLTGLGVAGDVDADAVLVPDLGDLTDEVVDDLYLQRQAGEPSPVLDVVTARTVGRAAVGDPQARLAPARAEDDPGQPAEVRARAGFAGAVRAEVVRRKRARRLLDYDDLLVLLRDALAHPVTGPVNVERVRGRYDVVLVDEFQDTDPVQWEVLRLAFAGARTLVLVGDPKQAIYAFRGGDVVTYLAAAREGTAQATLGRSWRADAPLLHALHAVLGGAALGSPEIVVRPVTAQHVERRLDGGAPLRLRQVTRTSLGLGRSGRDPRVGPVRDLVVADVVSDVVRQLSGGTRVRDDDGGWRALQPGDVAVLTRRNADAAAVRAGLADAGVPAVESGLSSVFGTESARAWLVLLQALEQPGSPGRVAATALTPFVPEDATALGAGGDAVRDALGDRVRRWAEVLAERGVAALLEAATADGAARRLLRRADGERVLTDLRHVGEVLHAAAVEGQLGTAALADWLRQRVEEAGRDYAEERSRRLETDAAAVQVVTVHASKGLEFPVVYVPFAWDRWESGQPVLRLHDDAGRRVLHVGGSTAPDYADALARHHEEERGEDLRLLYVALTRARSQVVAWWSPSTSSAAGPLTRVLLGDRGPDGAPPARVRVPRDDGVTHALHDLARRSGGAVAVEQVVPPQPVRWERPAGLRPPLAAATTDRVLDLGWRRTSYTGLTAAVHAAPRSAGGTGSRGDVVGVASEPETRGVEDEQDLVVSGDDAVALGVPSPMADLPGGAAFGTLVHRVLERVRTDGPHLDAELLVRCREAVTTRVPGVEAHALAVALAPVLSTPLGPLAGGRAWRDLADRDRLAEVSFELPLAGGDAPVGQGAALADLAGLLRRHLPAGDPYGAYAERLDDPSLRGERLRGYLTGSMDAVVRLPSEAGPRYLVVDWKTNRLAPAGERLTAAHYRPAALVAAMLEAHYPLQLLLYSAALHRFLRWRQPGYDPDRHLGGGLYLFVRGMCGPGTPVVDGVPCGVAAWRPPASLVVALSALLDGRSPG